MLNLQENKTLGISVQESFAQGIQKAEFKNRVKNNSENLRFFRWAFGATLLLTFGVVYLQGYGVFHLSDGIIYSLCGATVGQLAGLFVLVLRQK
jgi:hypothetical protein